MRLQVRPEFLLKGECDGELVKLPRIQRITLMKYRMSFALILFAGQCDEGVGECRWNSVTQGGVDMS